MLLNVNKHANEKLESVRFFFFFLNKIAYKRHTLDRRHRKVTNQRIVQWTEWWP